QGAPVKRALEGDHPVPLGPARCALVLSRHLDRALHRLRAGIGEEDDVGEAEPGQAPGKPLLALDAIEVRGMPEGPCLFLQSFDEGRMGMAKYVDGDAATEIEILLPLGREEPRALSAFE